jgi:hypothetical protein
LNLIVKSIMAKIKFKIQVNKIQDQIVLKMTNKGIPNDNNKIFTVKIMMIRIKNKKVNNIVNIVIQKIIALMIIVDLIKASAIIFKIVL